jgi:hypothetical protein
MPRDGVKLTSSINRCFHIHACLQTKQNLLQTLVLWVPEKLASMIQKWAIENKG